MIENILMTYMEELIEGGYDKAWRIKVSEKATKGYVRMSSEVTSPRYVNIPGD